MVTDRQLKIAMYAGYGTMLLVAVLTSETQSILARIIIAFAITLLAMAVYHYKRTEPAT